MILGLLYSIVRSLLDLLVLCRKTEAALQIEVLALRHQLRVLERQVHRPLLGEFVEHYQEARPHQGLGQRTPSGEPPAPGPAGRIVRRDRLGGLIHEYERAAA